MKILLAIDGSPSSAAAVDEICSRPWPAGSEIRVITVLPPLTAYTGWGVGGQDDPAHAYLLRQQEERADRLLGAAVYRLTRSAPDLTVTAVALEGKAKDVILDEVEQWGADLVVVGDHGWGIVRQFMLGSVSLAVALNAPCSVEIVRSRK